MLGIALATFFGIGALGILLAIFKFAVIDAKNPTNRMLGIGFFLLVIAFCVYWFVFAGQ